MPDKPDTVTLRVSRPVLFLVAGLLLGSGLGFLAGAWSVSTLARQARAVALETQSVASFAPETAEPEAIDISVDGRPYRGLADAPITLIEFTDYQCPFCGQYSREVYPALMSDHGDKIKYVVRNFPITAIHPHAAKAAEGAECAADQDRFWEYHDLLFQRQAALDVASLKRYATELGLDGGRFAACIDSGEKAELVAADMQVGFRHRVTGTPTFFLNGRRLVGAQPLEVFRSIIERETS